MKFYPQKNKNEPTYCLLPTIKCANLMLEESQCGFGVVNKGVLSEQNILIFVKDNNVMLDF